MCRQLQTVIWQRLNGQPSDFRSLDDSSPNIAHVRDLHRRIDLNTNERRRTHADETKDETTLLPPPEALVEAESFASRSGVGRAADPTRSPPVGVLQLTVASMFARHE